ncbi:MAG: IS3 family transposase [Nitrospira sp.]|nr:IS3 family transposase [Nitrospira sp.]
MALRRRQPNPSLLDNSDRGKQCAAIAYQEALTTAGITVNISQKWNWSDNACVDSFFGIVKRELIHHRQYRTREEARQEIFECLEAFCKRQRRHLALGHFS